MGYNKLVKNGIKKIYKEDLKTQKFYIGSICSDVRNMDDNILYKAHAIFIPNDEYLYNYMGAEVLSPEYDFYDAEGNCFWSNRLLIPITDLADDIVGSVGFDPMRYLEAHHNNDWSLNYYYYSTKKIFNKGNYLYGIDNTYLKAMEQGYLVLTDGVFDTLSFAKEGILSMALLGSVVTEQIAVQLRFIKRIIIAADNDNAGMELYEKLNGIHCNVAIIKQGLMKDADEVLKSRYRDDYIKTVYKAINNKITLHETMLMPSDRFKIQ